MPNQKPVLSRDILPTAATMLGICTTLIGLVKVIEARIGPSRVDEYCSLIAGLFLVSALASYGAMRTTRWPWISRTCEQAADLCFVVGLVSLALLVLLFAYEFV